MPKQIYSRIAKSLKARQKVKVVGIERNLQCKLIYGRENIDANVRLVQDDHCSLTATVDPVTYPSTLKDWIFSQPDCFLESIPNSSSLLLKRTSLTISRRNRQFQGMLSLAELESPNLPQDSDMVSIKIYLTNLSPYFEMEPDTIFPINIPGFQEVVLSVHKEGEISNIAEVSQIPYSELENLKEFIISICWLCSFASGSLSAIARIEVLFDGKIIYQELTSVDTTLKEGLKVIYDVDDLMEFIHRTYPYYHQSSTPYNLNNLINLGILAKHTPYIQVKTLLMSNFLEVLRYHYIQQNITPPSTLFRIDNRNLVYLCTDNTIVSFEKILKEHFCTEHNILGWETDFKNIRNEIVHTGNIAGVSQQDKVGRYKKLHHFCDRVILTLLGWDLAHGYYIPINCRSIRDPNRNQVNRVKFTR
ncbi:hypothetical protein [Laspinema olomoucense]|uniref:hypothetical protein n=1 Tax=Laspinema olomoucense TaxID=3231600 RepID=UPI0021BB95B2|nr:hypothetical protein [Laspinema sp. D3c]MCT7992444.1 hypothetical protein [Laspinema sp. D3c]